MLRLTISVLLILATPFPSAAAKRPDVDVPFAVIAEPEPGILADVYDLVIRDPDRWRQFWLQLHPDTPVPLVDFETRMVVVVSMGTAPFSGIDILVPRVTRSQGPGIRSLLLTVHVTEVRPGKDCVIHEPYRTTYKLIETEASHDVTFRRRNTYRSCR